MIAREPLPTTLQPSGETSKLSIVIVSYRCRDLLMACLSSLEDECRTQGYAVTVVDNASGDDTAEAVRRDFPWVTLVELHHNAGFSVANNVAIRDATAEYVLLLNPDTLVPTGALTAAVTELGTRPDVGMLGVKLVTESGELDHACKRGFPTPLSSLYHFTGLSRRWQASSRFASYRAGHIGEDDIAEVDAVNGAFMLARRSAIAEVGLLDEQYWLYMEDLDWCFRFWQSGWKILYWPRATVQHMKGGSSGQARAWVTNRAFHRGMWIFYRKFYWQRYPLPVSMLVFLGVWSKLLASAAISFARRSLVSA